MLYEVLHYNPETLAMTTYSIASLSSMDLTREGGQTTLQLGYPQHGAETHLRPLKPGLGILLSASLQFPDTIVGLAMLALSLYALQGYAPPDLCSSLGQASLHGIGCQLN